MSHDPEAHGRLDAQQREMKRIDGCVIILGFLVFLLSLSFFILTLGHGH